MSEERLQKVLARAGLGSRRQLEQWIRDGRISINAKPASLGDRVVAGDIVRVDGRIIAQTALEDVERRVLVYHKPAGEVCTRKDPEKRPTIFDRLPRLRQGRWVAVGRLDFNTSGLILLTTDGELANRLMHPSSEVEREYAVRVFGEVSTEVIGRLLSGVELEDGMARFQTLKDAGGEGANHWYHVTLQEGRNREVRRLWESQGVTVSRLIRVRYGPLELGRRLRAGQFEDLDAQRLQELLVLVGMARPRVPDTKKRSAEKKSSVRERPDGGPVRKKSGRIAKRGEPHEEWSNSPHPEPVSRHKPVARKRLPERPVRSKSRSPKA